MAIREQDVAFSELRLPREFDDLEGLFDADLRAIVMMAVDRANERLRLTRRESVVLQATLWNGITAALNESLSPLTVESR